MIHKIVVNYSPIGYCLREERQLNYRSEERIFIVVMRFYLMELYRDLLVQHEGQNRDKALLKTVNFAG